jgi:hypothetical protein
MKTEAPSPLVESRGQPARNRRFMMIGGGALSARGTESMMALSGTQRRFHAVRQLGRFRSEADLNRQARSAQSIANDPYATSASDRPKNSKQALV